MRILFVCLGNICRSPLAEGILKFKLEQCGLNVEVDSAGTSSWHDGSSPHIGSIEIAQKYGIDISSQVSRQVQSADLGRFDLILAMDSANYQSLKELDIDNSFSEKIKLILNYVYPNENRAVPDPYYTDNFEEVYDLLNQAADKLIAEISKTV